MVTRKNVRILILLACGIALVLASSGCKKKEDVSKPNDVDVPGAKDPGADIPPDKGPGADVPPDKGPGADVPPDKGPGADVPPDKGPTPGKVYVVEPLVGIDKVRFGMTVEQMKEVLGEPQMARPPLQEYQDAGFAIFALRDAVEMIACGHMRNPDAELVRNCKVRTNKGIGMGSSREDIILAYGQPSSTESKQLRIGGSAVALRYDSLNSQFMLMNDKVFYMSFAAEGSLIGAERPRPPRP
jgi:hypothetical protein